MGSPDRMLLRSACGRYGCTADFSLTDKSGSGSPRHVHHHHHHPQTIIPSPKVTSQKFKSSQDTRVSTLKSTTRSVKQVQSTLSINGHQTYQALVQGSYANSGTNHKSAISLAPSGRSFSDYSSGFDSDTEDKPKTDYTYARSSSYTKSATPSKDIINPNMSRTKLRNKMSYSDASSDEETSFLLHGRSLSKLDRKYASRQEADEVTPLNYFNIFNVKNGNRHVTTTSVESKEVSENQTDSLYLKESSRNQSSSVIQKVITATTSTVSKIVSLPFVIISSMWLRFWSLVYQFVCSVLVLDTWLLSRIKSNRKTLFLLLLVPLLVPLLLWLTGLGLRESSSPIENPSSSSLSDFYIFQSLAQWFKIGGNKMLPPKDAEASIAFGSDSDHLKDVFREMFQRESSVLAKRNEEYLKEHVSALKQEQEILKRLQEDQMKAFTLHTHELTEELKYIKLNLKSVDSGKINVALNTECAGLRTQVGRIEKEVVRLQDQLLQLRNCCRNQTLMVESVDKRYAGFLFDMLNSSYPTNGPFAPLVDLLHRHFVTAEDLSSRLSSFSDVFLLELNERASRLAKDEGRRLESDLERLKRELREEMKDGQTLAYSASSSFNHNRSCTSEDVVQKIVRNALFIYDADKIGKFDYALESAGGSIISTRCTETYHTGTAQFSLFGVPFWYTSNSPRTVIQPDVKPGQCWALKGTTGYLVIQLSANIRPTAFTLEHIPKSLSPNGRIDSAPKDFSVLGLKDEKDFEGIHLGRFTYQDNGESLQYFIVADPDPGYFPIMELRIHSNHGNMEYTCLYRFRVHGSPQ